jgi:putative transposase
VVGVGRLPRHTNSKGTAVKKSSQIQSVDASGSAVPERVSVAVAEIAPRTWPRACWRWPWAPVCR